ncbi:hypothetical protein ACFWUP_30965 [Nocardia sp. NPDC058658]|uniref:lipase/acyltransferase domain-containing protein n=1 Tax=Nocardia sp. NPDC058658 TaxID=3346580 RepID=UPI0036632376
MARSSEYPSGSTGLTSSQGLTMSDSNQVTDDAVVVIPGIMGSELRDTSTDKLIWGFSPRTLARLWTAGESAFDLLRVQDDQPGTVRPGGLLRTTTAAPVLGGYEPYTRLVDELQAIVLRPDAVAEFAYDWRMSTRYNGKLLAAAIDRHIRKWREAVDRPQARVHLVAHSMGGLLCRELTTISGALDDVASIITVGTPFGGSPKAAQVLNSGRGLPIPLPAKRLRAVAVTMAGLHDLLPTYRCVDDGDYIRRLTSSDVADLGGNLNLAEQTFDRAHMLRDTVLPHHHPVIGKAQKTVCSLRLDAGVVTGLHHSFHPASDTDVIRDPKTGAPLPFSGDGDGTVPHNAAQPNGSAKILELPQQHGPIAQSPQTIAAITAIILGRTPHFGIKLGPDDLGIDAPDLATAGIAFDTEITGAQSPVGLRMTLTDTETNTDVGRPVAHRREGRLLITVTAPEPSIFRLTVRRGADAVSQLIIVTPHGA